MESKRNEWIVIVISVAVTVIAKRYIQDAFTALSDLSLITDMLLFVGIYLIIFVPTNFLVNRTKNSS